MSSPARFLLVLLVGLLASVASAARADERAEALYQRFRELYLRPDTTGAELDEALGAVLAAHDRAPEVYKYAFGAAAVHERQEDYAAAVEWYARAAALATTEAEQADARAALRACRNELAKAAVANWGGPGMEYRFLLKEASLEPDPELVQELPAALPRIGRGAPREPLVEALERALPKHRVSSLGDFVVASGEGDPVQHYEQGIHDFYGHFRRRYFSTPPARPIVAVLDRFPDQVVEASRRLYPSVPLGGYQPFLGYFNPSDNLVAATVYGGYGTLLHELVHALMHTVHPRAPSWLVEGMATLFERSAWQDGVLVPLPNWRMDFLAEDQALDLERFADFAPRAGLDRGQLAWVRLLLLYLDAGDRVPELLALADREGEGLSPARAVAEMEIDDPSWQTFVAEACTAYRADVQRSRGRLVNPAEVRYVQRALNRVLGLDLGVDGLWGPRTEDAVRTFQARNGLVPDGVVGPRTLRALRQAFTGAVLED